MKTIERLYHETNNKLYYETKVNGVTVTLYEGLDGDYHVTLEDSEREHTHEIFEDFDQANAFFDSLVEDEYQSEQENEPYSFDDHSLPKSTKEMDSMMMQRLKELIWGTDTENP